MKKATVQPGTFGISRVEGAFTLLELLVAMTVIAVLAALSYPVYTGFRVRTDNLACVNNLRLLAGRAIQFAHEHNGLMPSADWSKAGTRTSATGESYVVKGSLIPYLGDWRKPGSPSPTEVARCPADYRLHDWKSAWQTYGLNTYAKGIEETASNGTPALNPGTTTYTGRIFSIPRPAGMAMFMDGVKPYVGTDGSVIYPTTINFSIFTSRQDTLYAHKTHINVVFMDGHGEAISQKEMRARANVKDVFWTGGLDLP